MSSLAGTTATTSGSFTLANMICNVASMSATLTATSVTSTTTNLTCGNLSGIITQAMQIQGLTTTTTLICNSTANIAGTANLSGGTTTTSLIVSGNSNVTTLTANGLVTCSAGLTVTGNITGTLVTSSQPYVTALGNLTSLNVTGATTTNSLTCNTTASIATLTVTGNSNVNTVTATGLVTCANLIVQTGVTPQIYVDTTNNRVAINKSSAAYALDVNGIVNTNNSYYVNGVQVLSGTLLSATVQSNITQTGNLTSLTVTGNISCSNLTGTLQTASQTNITSVGTLGTLTVTGNGNIGANTLFVNAGTTNRVGINTTSPGYTLDVSGGGVNIPSANYYRLGGVTALGYKSTGATVPGDLDVTGILYIGSRIPDATTLTQGGYVGWNITSGTGEMDFVSKCGSGSGGFNFYNSTGNNSAFSTGKSLLASIDSNGYMTCKRPCIRIYRSGGWSVTNGEVITKGGTISFERSPGSSGYSSTTGIYTVPTAGVWRFSLYVRVADGAGSLSMKPATTSAYSVPNSDNSYWVPTDGGNRRTMSWTEIVYMADSTYGYMCYSGQATTIQDYVFCGEFIGS